MRGMRRGMGLADGNKPLHQKLQEEYAELSNRNLIVELRALAEGNLRDISNDYDSQILRRMARNQSGMMLIMAELISRIPPGTLIERE